MFQLGVEDGDIKSRWGDIGREMGLIFQLTDDLLDISKEKDKGRQIGDDIRSGIPTPLSLFAYNHIPEVDKKCFTENFGDSDISDSKLRLMLRIYQTSGAIEHINKLIRQKVKIVETILESLNISSSHWMYDLIGYSVTRKT
jgi:geranylgeranyl pyrophosphate synthase